MAETITVDPTPDAEVIGTPEGVDLSAEEADSLAVGEQLVAQQEQLLAGKYKDAEALEKAYLNLQKKLGNEEDVEEDNQVEAEQEEVLQEESEEGSEELSEAAQVITSAAEEFEANDGQITQETYDRLSSMSSQDLVQAYMEAQSMSEPADVAPDISDADVNFIKEQAGGEEAYSQMVEWATNNLEVSQIEAFDEIINTGSPQAISLAVNGLMSQYQNENGYEGRMLTGKPPVNSRDAYRSQAELVQAMSDPRYENDPAYRQDVIAKLERSENLQF